jgi:dipeptidyl aminopeptidase/acylaminoacyl peptidase
MRLEDLTKLRVAGDPRLDATGSRVAFVVSGMDAEQNRSRSGLPASTNRASRLLTALDGLALAPRWSPDGSQLALLSGRNGELQLHLLILAVTSRSVER